MTIAQGFSDNSLAKNWAENWAKNVTSRVFTCKKTTVQESSFHYIHIEKNAPPTGGHVFSPIWTIFKLIRDINQTNVLTNFHENWAKIVSSILECLQGFSIAKQGKQPPPGSHVIQLTGTIFELNSYIKETNILTIFHENWAKNVTSRVFTCFHCIHIETNAPPTGGHVFSPIWTIFKNLFTRKTAPPTGGHTNILTNFELDRDFIGTKLLTKFHEDRTINVASRVFMNKCGRTDRQWTKTGHKSLPEQSDKFPALWRPCFPTDRPIFKLIQKLNVVYRVLTWKNAPLPGAMFCNTPEPFSNSSTP
ncbi:hypothetical protein DPMN_001270 [Dreissena polymorpha]|uniref:Uncharacterized protein n=1 Tax=Dreissena polymorpha TaxID=45954 RepID=A0A9D4MKM4_DREPO|nr:hypothetical protein DPMN_001270 [Dreissena polymorpha]